MLEHKKTSKRRFAGNTTIDGSIKAISKSPFQTREAITFHLALSLKVPWLLLKPS